MQEQLPKNHFIDKKPLKTKIITLVITLIAIVGAIVFALENLFSDFTPTNTMNTAIDENQNISYTGVIKYLPPEYYFDENIEYELVDENKNPIILLKSKDERLKMAENLNVTVKGTKTKTSEGEPILVVTEVIVSRQE
ncbi:hypothetical protein KBG31_03575 [Patescibacteria group bacterium]|nr:hypothetical protein [Patescibacteria group bacterium]